MLTFILNKRAALLQISDAAFLLNERAQASGGRNSKVNERFRVLLMKFELYGLNSSVFTQ